MFDEKITLDNENKSFLRNKWEKILKRIISRRIPNKQTQNDEIIYLNSEDEIKRVKSEVKELCKEFPVYALKN